MLCKDEVDIIGHTVQHLLDQVDHVIVADNMSTDGTREVLESLACDRLTIRDDKEVGYWQSRKTTNLARRAHQQGYAWVVPCDADEIWTAPKGTVSQFLDSIGPDVQVVRAKLWNYVSTTSDDTAEENPLLRIRWHFKSAGALPKVAARTAQDLLIDPGNHSANYTEDAFAIQIDGLNINHYSWRSEEQYLKKIRNGLVAYAATDMPETYGAHWRMFEGATDEDIVSHYRRWFCLPNPEENKDLVLSTE